MFLFFPFFLLFFFLLYVGTADEEPEEADDQDPRLQQVEPQFEMPRRALCTNCYGRASCVNNFLHSPLAAAQLSGIDDYLDFVGKTYYPNTEQPVCNDEVCAFSQLIGNGSTYNACLPVKRSLYTYGEPLWECYVPNFDLRW